MPMVIVTVPLSPQVTLLQLEWNVRIHNPQEMLDIYNSIYCVYTACMILIYDWFLCFNEELRYIWKWHSGVTVSTLVYVLCRYGMLIHNILVVVMVYLMLDLSCAANLWTQVTTEILSTIAISAFSALRVYALSNKNIWLTITIVLLVLPPAAIFIVQSVYKGPLNLPSPVNCTASDSIPLALDISITLVTWASQLAIELLVVAVTWWYSYQLHHVQKGINIGNSISSLLVHNESMYFLFLVSLYTIDIIFKTALVPENVLYVAGFLELFYDPIASILICHFMLSLPQFDSNAAFAADSGAGSRIRDHMASTGLQFGVQPSELLPAFIVSFAHPVHVDWSLSETEPGTIVNNGSERQEMDVMATESEAPPRSDSTPEGEPASKPRVEHSV
ncbi:hypothetical protein V8D89_002965 [Ganoderma adspersum]